jgi:hypothetical protein
MPLSDADAWEILRPIDESGVEELRRPELFPAALEHVARVRAEGDWL